MNALKTSLRQEIKRKLKSLTDSEKERQSHVVTQKLFSLPQYQKSERIAVFVNMDDEIRTEAILKDALNKKKTCFIPRYDSGSSFMDMVRIESWSDIESLPCTKWNIKQPLFTEERETALKSGGLDLILVPGLAFTETGARLGRGRGYYDTYLKKCLPDQSERVTTFVGIAYKEQIVPSVPKHDWDVEVHKVLYDTE